MVRYLLIDTDNPYHVVYYFPTSVFSLLASSLRFFLTTCQRRAMASSKLEGSNMRKTPSQRLPPPVLFQGPPSHNASSNSLAHTPTLNAPGGSQPAPSPPFLQRTRSTGPQASFRSQGSFQSQLSLSPFLSRAQSKGGEVDPSDAIWREMQNSLAEVELSAASSEHVFGEKHSKALEDLREKQLKLAHAWARNEADDEVVETKNTDEENENKESSTSKMITQNTTATGGGDAAERERTETEGVSYKTLDEETEKDILLARERREANDRYFDRVNNGVLDVVSKLEEVAEAMRIVERESRDIWSDSETSSTSSDTPTADAR